MIKTEFFFFFKKAACVDKSKCRSIKVSSQLVRGGLQDTTSGWTLIIVSLHNKSLICAVFTSKQENFE